MYKSVIKHRSFSWVSRRPSRSALKIPLRLPRHEDLENSRAQPHHPLPTHPDGFASALVSVCIRLPVPGPASPCISAYQPPLPQFTAPLLSLCLSVIVVVQSLSHGQLFETPRTAARQASLSFIISQNLLKLMCIESVMPSNHLILCHPFLLLPSIFPSIRVFFSESALPIR